jgi:hypothetical protein
MTTLVCYLCTVCETDIIWLCHKKRYVKQTGSGYVTINGMWNRQDLVIPNPVCFTFHFLWHNKILSVLHTTYIDITGSCLLYIPLNMTLPDPVCFTYRLLWHNRILSVLHCHLCLQYRYQMYIYIHHCPQYVMLHMSKMTSIEKWHVSLLVILVYIHTINGSTNLSMVCWFVRWLENWVEY